MPKGFQSTQVPNAGANAPRSVATRALLQLIADVGFGRLERLYIRNGEAAFSPAPVAVRTVKFAASRDGPTFTSPEQMLTKPQVGALLDALASIKMGCVARLEVRDASQHSWKSWLIRCWRVAMTEHQAAFVDAKILAVVRCVGFRASHQLRRFGYDQQDLSQELVLHYIEQRHHYDAARSSPPTFLATVCRNQTFKMLAAAMAQKRGAGTTVESLSAPVAIGPSGETIERVATISEDSYNMNAGRRSRSNAELMLLRIDVDQVVSGLPAELAELADLFAAGESPVGVARQLQISRATVHRRVVQLRCIFRRAGLDAYVKAQEAA